MIDLGLLNAATKAVNAKPRKHVTPAVLMAVVLQESSGVPYFVDTKPGSIYQANLSAAIVHTVKYHSATGKLISTKHIETGLTRKDILDVITIPAQVGNFRVPSAMVGKLAKFRFEYGYWVRYSHIADLKDRFLYSSSWGLCQFMGPNISKHPDIEGFQFIRRFAADVDMQLLYAAGMVDDLLAATGGDVEAMYRGYNSGNTHSHDSQVVARAQGVHASALKIQQFIDERTKK